MPFQVPNGQKKMIPPKQTSEYHINPALIYTLEHLRNGLMSLCGHNSFTVYGDIMQLTIRVNASQPKGLIAQLQQEGFLRCKAMEQLPQAIKQDILTNGWYQMQPHDRA